MTPVNNVIIELLVKP